MASIPAAARTLDELVQSLPQELIDDIKKEVFRCSPGPRAFTLNTYAHPPMTTPGHYAKIHLSRPDSNTLLQVSQATRAAFIASYYDSATLLFDTAHAFDIWRYNMKEEVFGKVKEVRVPRKDLFDVAFAKGVWRRWVLEGHPGYRLGEKVKHMVESEMMKGLN